MTCTSQIIRLFAFKPLEMKTIILRGLGLIILKTGLYEQIIDQALAQALDKVKNEYITKTGKIDKEEASLILAK